MVAQRIQVNYDCLQEMMKLFIRHTDMTVALTFQIEGLVDQLQSGAWRGIGAEVFYAEMHDLVLPALRKLQDSLQFAGEGMGKIHTILREAEEEAARLFRGEGEKPPHQEGSGGRNKKWWEGAPVVPYTLRPSETLQDLALRLGININALFDLNGGYSAVWNLRPGSRINLPIPGLVPNHPLSGELPRYFTEKPRSLLPYPLTFQEILEAWRKLTPLEEEIEFALAMTSPANAPFDHYLTFDFVMGWLTQNQLAIEETSRRFDIDPVLLSGILASEMLYDYNLIDRISDLFGAGNGSGYASAHDETLWAAYTYLESLYGTDGHPWNVDAFAPSPGDDPSGYTLTDKGAIAAAAMVARYYTDYYVNAQSLSPADAAYKRHHLNPQDMAAIFGAYRQGCQAIPPGTASSQSGYPDLGTFRNGGQNLGDNGIIALPFMRYFTGKVK